MNKVKNIFTLESGNMIQIIDNRAGRNIVICGVGTNKELHLVLDYTEVDKFCETLKAVKETP